MKTFEEILIESDRTPYTGEVLFSNHDDLEAVSQRDNFIELIKVELGKAIQGNKINRFNFISHLLSAFGNDHPDNKQIYMQMIGFAIRKFDNRSETENEQIFQLLLDLLWHQDNGLKELSIEEQQRLHAFLNLASSLKYEVTENGDDTFFAVKKAVDLIHYQRQYGDTEGLTKLFSNHFDEKIRLYTNERQNQNWL